MHAINNTLKRLLPKNKFARSVSVLAGGTFGAQALTILFSPILTRLYLPEDYGLVALFGGLLSILTVIVCLRYELAIPLPTEEQDALSILVLSAIATCSITLMSFLILLLAGKTICEVLNAPDLYNYLWFMPLSVLLIGCYQILNYWAIRTGSFSLIAKSKLIQTVSSISFQLLGFRLGALGLLIGMIAGQFASVARLGSWVPNSFLLKKIQLRDVRSQAYRYRHFPIFSSWAGIFNAGSAALPSLLITSFFGLAAAGYFALTNRVMGAPSILLGQAIGQVYTSEAANAKRNGNLAELVAQVHNNLTQIAMPAALILIFISPELITFIYGEKWRQSGIFLQYLTPMFYTQFIISPLASTVDILERQSLNMKLQFIMLVSRFTSLIIGGLLNSLPYAIILYSMSSTLYYVLRLFVIIRLTDNNLKLFIQSTIKSSISGLLIISPILFTSLNIHDKKSFYISLSLTILLYSAHIIKIMLTNNTKIA